MARTKRGVTSHARHKKVLKQVKGQYGRRKHTIRIAKQALEKALQYAYRDRRAKKRELLADIAYNNPEVFKSIVKKVQSSLN